MTDTGDTRWGTQIARLQDWRAELLRRTEAIEADLDQDLSRDFEDHASESEHHEVAEKLGTIGLRELRAIDDALARIEKGEYGICKICGETISDARLTVVPTTTECRDCAQSHDRRGRGAQAAAS